MNSVAENCPLLSSVRTDHLFEAMRVTSRSEVVVQILTSWYLAGNRRYGIEKIKESLVEPAFEVTSKQFSVGVSGVGWFAVKDNNIIVISSYFFQILE